MNATASQINEAQEVIGRLMSEARGNLFLALRDADKALDRAFVLAEYGEDEEA